MMTREDKLLDALGSVDEKYIERSMPHEFDSADNISSVPHGQAYELPPLPEKKRRKPKYVMFAGAAAAVVALVGGLWLWNSAAGGNIFTSDRDVNIMLPPDTPDIVISDESREDFLRREYPQYFGYSAFKGLEIYSRNNGVNIKFAVTDGTDLPKTPEQLSSLIFLDEWDMKTILSTYDTPYKFYIGEVDDNGNVTEMDAEYVSMIHEMLGLKNESSGKYDRFSSITDTDMPDPFVYDDADYYTSFHYQFVRRFEDITLDLADKERTDEFMNAYYSDHAETPYKLDDGMNIYHCSQELNIPLYDVYEAMLQSNEYYAEAAEKNGKNYDDFLFTAEELEAIHIGGKAMIASAFASEYSIVSGENVFSPKWMYYHTAEDYELCGITADQVREKLELYSTLGFTTDGAWDSFRTKLEKYIEKLDSDESGYIRFGGITENVTVPVYGGWDTDDGIDNVILYEIRTLTPNGDRLFRVCADNLYLAQDSKDHIICDPYFTVCDLNGRELARALYTRYDLDVGHNEGFRLDTAELDEYVELFQLIPEGSAISEGEHIVAALMYGTKATGYQTGIFYFKDDSELVPIAECQNLSGMFEYSYTTITDPINNICIDVDIDNVTASVYRIDPEENDGDGYITLPFTTFSTPVTGARFAQIVCNNVQMTQDGLSFEDATVELYDSASYLLIASAPFVSPVVGLESYYSDGDIEMRISEGNDGHALITVSLPTASGSVASGPVTYVTTIYWYDGNDLVLPDASKSEYNIPTVLSPDNIYLGKNDIICITDKNGTYREFSIRESQSGRPVMYLEKSTVVSETAEAAPAELLAAPAKMTFNIQFSTLSDQSGNPGTANIFSAACTSDGTAYQNATMRMDNRNVLTTVSELIDGDIAESITEALAPYCDESGSINADRLSNAPIVTTYSLMSDTIYNDSLHYINKDCLILYSAADDDIMIFVRDELCTEFRHIIETLWSLHDDHPNIAAVCVRNDIESGYYIQIIDSKTSLETDIQSYLQSAGCNMLLCRFITPEALRESWPEVTPLIYDGDGQVYLNSYPDGNCINFYGTLYSYGNIEYNTFDEAAKELLECGVPEEDISRWRETGGEGFRTAEPYAQTLDIVRLPITDPGRKSTFYHMSAGVILEHTEVTGDLSYEYYSVLTPETRFGLSNIYSVVSLFRRKPVIHDGEGGINYEIRKIELVTEYKDGKETMYVRLIADKEYWDDIRTYVSDYLDGANPGSTAPSISFELAGTAVDTSSLERYND